MSNIISPIAINALNEALCNIYWYKKDLKRFLTQSISDKNIILAIDWDKYKREIVADILDILCDDQTKYIEDIKCLIFEVTSMTSFSHLKSLEDGEAKANKAEVSINTLKNILQTSDIYRKDYKIIKEKRKEYVDRLSCKSKFNNNLNKLKYEYFELVGSDNAQLRGYKLEKLLYKIFDLFDLDPKASFKNSGEQVDGAFSLENTDYLLEAKWTHQKTSGADLDSFSAKVGRKLENTLGLFLSINGFSEDAVNLYIQNKSSIILVDGADLMAVVDGRIGLKELLIRKRRYASQTGNIYLKINEILSD